jgi:hypothetical protein
VIVSVVAVAFGCDPFAVMTIVSELSEPKSTLNNRRGVSAALPILALDVACRMCRPRQSRRSFSIFRRNRIAGSLEAGVNLDSLVLLEDEEDFFEARHFRAIHALVGIRSTFAVSI